MSTAPTTNPKPAIVGWDDAPPQSMTSRKSMWDDVIDQVRQRTDGKWAKVQKPPKWNSSSLSALRKKHTDLQFENPTVARGRGAKAGEFVWIRQRVDGDNIELPAEEATSEDA